MDNGDSTGSHQTDRSPSPLQSLAIVGVLGVEMALSITVGYLVGDWLDNKLGTAPWLMVSLLLVGIGAGFLVLVRTARRSQGHR